MKIRLVKHLSFRLGISSCY